MVIVGALIWTMYFYKPDQSILPVPSISIEPFPELETPVTGELLIGEFLELNSWTSHDLAQFTSAWVTLTDFERNQTRGSGHLQRFHNAILHQLNAQQALVAVGDDEEAYVASARIHQLGVTLGMGDELPNLKIPGATNAARNEAGEVAITTTISTQRPDKLKSQPHAAKIIDEFLELDNWTTRDLHHFTTS